MYLNVYESTLFGHFAFGLVRFEQLHLFALLSCLSFSGWPT